LVDANNRLPNYIVTTNYGTLTVTSGIQAHDDAAAYDAAGGTWASGMDFGFGLQPWVIARSGTAHQGAFIGDGGNIATTNNSAWGLYANGTPTNLAVAYRGFSNSVPVGMAFKLQWRSGSIGNNPYNFAGFSLRTGNASATTSDYSAGERFSFFYQGGGQDNARIRDGSGTLYAPAPGINFSNLHRGVAVELTLLSSNTYRLMIADAATTNVLAVFDNRLLAGSGAIQSVALYDSQTDPGLGEYDGNQLFNNMEISSPSSSLPPVIQSVTRSAGQLGLNWSALAGRSYQVQYKTNPAQAYWSNLSGSVTATNFTGTATDAVGPDRQRVYRIFLAP
jgi:hypothetical protein